MSSIIENIIKNAPITFEDNYKRRLEAREKVLSNRRNNLNPLRNRGSIEFDKYGNACRFYPTVHYRKDFARLNIMIKEIDKELSEISKYI